MGARKKNILQDWPTPPSHGWDYPPTPEIGSINYGVIECQPSPSDWALGTIQYPETTGDWENRLPDMEPQSGVMGDTSACVTFSALNQLETLTDWTTLPENHKNFLQANGYIFNDKLNFSDGFIAKLSGTIPGVGNSAPRVWDTIRHYGLIPERMWPLVPGQSVSSWYREPTQAEIDLGKAFLQLFEIQYESGPVGATNNTDTQLSSWLTEAPIQIFTRVCPGWFGDSVIQACGEYPTQHATMLYKLSEGTRHLFDHYQPYRRLLAPNYPIPYTFRGIIKAKLGVELPEVKDTPMTQREAEVVVLQLYRTLLNREPESWVVVQSHANYLKRATNRSDEVALRNFWAGWKPEIKVKAQEY